MTIPAGVERTAPVDAARTATVVGGGPAGLMAAEVLATAGFAVTVYDHKPSVGRKFLLAGRGGLNITHSEEPAIFLSRYHPANQRLADAIESFGPDDLRTWCADLGEPTFVGSSGRVFPQSFRATPLLRAWLARLNDLGVMFALRHRWLGFVPQTNDSSFQNADGSTVEVAADVTIMALGGASWPRVGSDGGWVQAFTDAKIAVRALRPANCGVQTKWTDIFAERFAGEPLKNVAVMVGDASVRGDAMVTTSGLEGGPIYAHSSAIRDQLEDFDASTVFFDLHPDLTRTQLGDRLSQRQRPKQSMSTWLKRSGFTPVAIGLMREATANALPANVDNMAALAKAVPVPVHAMSSIERAISTAGGVELEELDDSFMVRSRPGVFVVGEMLDWEAPTGGYLLQACFSTAVAAATAASSRVATSIDQLAKMAMTGNPGLGTTRLIVIDGPAGSGKTTLSRRLAERLDAELYHLDAALEGWSGLANLRDRYEHEMLAPLQQDEPAIFPEWDWDNDKVSGSRTLKPTSILIVEGVGGADRIVDGLASLQIWVEVPQAERLRRGIERDGAATEDLWNAWLVEETALHLDQNTRARADLIVDGTQPLPAI